MLGPKDRVEHDEYLCLMAQSTFCLVVRGQAAWSPRLDEAVFAGCIPVIIADHYEPPFSSVLDYPAFSLRVNESMVSGEWHASHSYSDELARMLRAVPMSQRETLLSNVVAARAAFRYDVPMAPYNSTGALELIMFDLWLRQHK